MNLSVAAIHAAERLPLPDLALRMGVNGLVAGASRRLVQSSESDGAFAAAMATQPVAAHVDAANAQHYELPPAFFAHVLGPRRKYSCCFYDTDATTLAEAEIRALEETCAHADLKDGQRVLELGCGWGSLSLFMAERYPNSEIVCVSNASAQRQHIEAELKKRSLTNVTVITDDMNRFSPNGLFDRIVSVEMFEHMSNWRLLLERARSWIEPDGRMFIHVFSHRTHPYRFDHDSDTDWIARYFFTGGVMPSHGLIGQFADSFNVESQWRWSGRHYERTALHWLQNFDSRRGPIRDIFKNVYGDDAGVWMRRWRLFFLATAGLFGHAGGEEWGVSHYLLRPAPTGGSGRAAPRGQEAGD